MYYSNGDSDLLVLFIIIWECDENATRYELIEGIVFRKRESIFLELDNSDRITGPYAGGVRGGSDEPPFLVEYIYVYTINVIDSRSTTGMVRLETRDKSRIILAHRKVSGVARLWGSHSPRERGWVWICGRRDLLTDDSP